MGYAQIGADDLGDFDESEPALLEAAFGKRVAAENHVLFDPSRVRSIQRVAVGRTGGVITSAFWPGELKAQANFVYAAGRAPAMVEQARELGWLVAPSPHLAFFNSSPSQRLYMAPPIDALEYATRWGNDVHVAGRYDPDTIEDEIWPWLKARGYATDDDDDVFERFRRKYLKRRKGDLRPGMRFKKRWPAGTASLAESLRSDLAAILGAAGERLPG